MFKKLVLLVTFATLPSIAVAERVTVTNNTSNSIYQLYAWPQELIPRTINILGAPLSPGSETEVTVDNSFEDCVFIFQFDPNDPVKKKKRGYRKIAFGTATANVCAKNKTVSFGSSPY